MEMKYPSDITEGGGPRVVLSSDNITPCGECGCGTSSEYSWQCEKCDETHETCGETLYPVVCKEHFDRHLALLEHELTTSNAEQHRPYFSLLLSSEPGEVVFCTECDDGTSDMFNDVPSFYCGMCVYCLAMGREVNGAENMFVYEASFAAHISDLAFIEGAVGLEKCQFEEETDITHIYDNMFLTR